MFSIFKRKDEISVKKKTNNEWVEEIHETFYSEVDRILAMANIQNSLDTDKEELLIKKDKLKALGFTTTKEVREGALEEARLFNLKNENDKKENLIKAINYFSFKYPFYKFITEDSVKKICEKYNLVYATVDKYIGTVPDKNVEEIENFKIEDVDKCYLDSIAMGIGVPAHITHIGYGLYKEKEDERDFYRSIGYYRRVSESPLEICAPLKDFNSKGMAVRDSKLEILDPVVLQPVFFEGEKHYLIVTAWGLEASDELVVNSISN